MRMACRPARTALTVSGVVPARRPSMMTAAPCGRDSTINVPTRPADAGAAVVFFDDNFGDFDFGGGITRARLSGFATGRADCSGGIDCSGTGVGAAAVGGGAVNAVTSVNSF